MLDEPNMLLDDGLAVLGPPNEKVELVLSVALLLLVEEPNPEPKNPLLDCSCVFVFSCLFAENKLEPFEELAPNNGVDELLVCAVVFELVFEVIPNLNKLGAEAVLFASVLAVEGADDASLLAELNGFSILNAAVFD